MKPVFCLAHLSDPHLSQPRLATPLDIANKRVLGYLSWNLRRRHEHRASVLAALCRDIEKHSPDHTVITGDLTQIGLPDEFRQVRAWLENLGSPEDITLIPGNHDRYVAAPSQDTLSLWRPYYQSDQRGDDFPSLRIRGPLAIIGTNSSPPTAPFLATGEIGPDQCQRLAERLHSSRDRFRVMLIHHPPHPEATKRRKRLIDAARVVQVLKSHGCGLVLHGHSHHWQLHWLPGPHCPIPLIGVPSASAVGRRRGYRARYHLYRFHPGAEKWRIEVEIRGFDPEENGFIQEGRFDLASPG